MAHFVETRQVNDAKLAEFMQVYKKNLERAVKEKPGQYAWPLSELDTVAGRMEAALKKGSYNHDSPAFKWTAKELGIQPTRTAIETFLSGAA